MVLPQVNEIRSSPGPLAVDTGLAHEYQPAVLPQPSLLGWGRGVGRRVPHPSQELEVHELHHQACLHSGQTPQVQSEGF